MSAGSVSLTLAECGGAFAPVFQVSEPVLHLDAHIDHTAMLTDTWTPLHNTWTRDARVLPFHVTELTKPVGSTYNPSTAFFIGGGVPNALRELQLIRGRW